MREENGKPVPIGIRHGDMVRIMAGRSKGKTGKVLSVNRLKNTVTVEHANIIKKHTRPNPSKNIKGGILEKEAPAARFERDAGLSRMRQAHACGTHDSAGRHQGARLPALQHDF